MHLFLTSSPCDDNVPDGAALPCIWDVRNGFVDNLRRFVTPGCSGTVIAATPDAHDINDEMTSTFAKCFAYHGMPLASMTLIDDRTEEDLPRAVRQSGVIILGGGHVPTQQAFFEHLGLRALLRGYNGLVMGISAGSMNCATHVYAQPELPGESLDRDYQRFIPGLALTDLNVLPHYNQVGQSILDGQRLFEDITFADSFGHVFYALEDGSYILQSRGQTTLYGSCRRIADGRMELICREGEQVTL